MTSEMTVPVPRTQRDFAVAVRRLHDEYLKASHQSAVPPESRNEREQGLAIAVEMVELVADLDDLTPINDVRLGDKESEGSLTAMRLSDSRRWDESATKALDQIQSMLVRRMRALERPWSSIGTALGMSGQGASKKAQEKGWSSFLDMRP